MFILLGKANRQRCLLQRQPRKAKKAKKRHKTERAKKKKTLTDKITSHKFKDKTFNRGLNITLETGTVTTNMASWPNEKEQNV